MNKKKKNRVFLLLILLLGVTVGFAALATTLKINGNASITKNTWSVYWANVGNQTGVTPTTAPGITSEDEDHQNNILSFGVTLDKPGDFYEFQVDAVNDGTLDAMLSVITTNITSGGSPATLPSYIEYTVKYADDEEPLEKHLLAKNTTERYKIRLEFLKTITNDELNNMPEEGLEYDIDVEVPYVQADDTATDRHAEPVCPGPECVYTYTTDTLWYKDDRKTAVTDYTIDYTTLKDYSDKQRTVFLGFILDDDKYITKAYACGIKDYGESTEQMFCIRGMLGSYLGKDQEEINAVYADNKALLQSENLWNGTCTTGISGEYETLGCTSYYFDRTRNTFGAYATRFGSINLQEKNGYPGCYIGNDGGIYCG